MSTVIFNLTGNRSNGSCHGVRELKSLWAEAYIAGATGEDPVDAKHCVSYIMDILEDEGVAPYMVLVSNKTLGGALEKEGVTVYY